MNVKLAVLKVVHYPRKEMIGTQGRSGGNSTTSNTVKAASQCLRACPGTLQAALAHPAGLRGMKMERVIRAVSDEGGMPRLKASGCQELEETSLLPAAAGLVVCEARNLACCPLLPTE